MNDYYDYDYDYGVDNEKFARWNIHVQQKKCLFFSFVFRAIHVCVYDPPPQKKLSSPYVILYLIRFFFFLKPRLPKTGSQIRIINLGNNSSAWSIYLNIIGTRNYHSI